jgi:hypothetical protein
VSTIYAGGPVLIGSSEMSPINFVSWFVSVLCILIVFCIDWAASICLLSTCNLLLSKDSKELYKSDVGSVSWATGAGDGACSTWAASAVEIGTPMIETEAGSASAGGLYGIDGAGADSYAYSWTGTGAGSVSSGAEGGM